MKLKSGWKNSHPGFVSRLSAPLRLKHLKGSNCFHNTRVQPWGLLSRGESGPTAPWSLPSLVTGCTTVWSSRSHRSTQTTAIYCTFDSKTFRRCVTRPKTTSELVWEKFTNLALTSICPVDQVLAWKPVCRSPHLNVPLTDTSLL